MKYYFKGALYESEDFEGLDVNADDRVVEDSDSDYNYDDSPEDVEVVDSFTVSTKSVDPSIVVKKVNLKDKLFLNMINFIKVNLGDIPELENIIKIQLAIYNEIQELALSVSARYGREVGKSKEDVNSRNDISYRRVQVMYRFISYYLIKYDRDICEWYATILNQHLFNNDNAAKVIEGSYSSIDPDIMMKIRKIVEAEFNILGQTPSKFNDLVRAEFFNDSVALAQDLGKNAGVFENLTQLVSIYRDGIPVKNKDLGVLYVFVGADPYAKKISASIKMLNAEVNKVMKIQSLKNYYIERFKKSLTDMQLNQDIIDKRMNELKVGLTNGSISKLEDFNNLMSQAKSNTMSDPDKEKLGDRVVAMNKAYKLKLNKVKSGKVDKSKTPETKTENK